MFKLLVLTSWLATQLVQAAAGTDTTADDDGNNCNKNPNNDVYGCSFQRIAVKTEEDTPMQQLEINICTTIPLLVRKKSKYDNYVFFYCSICIIICVILTIPLTMEDTCLWSYMKRKYCRKLHLVQELASCCWCSCCLLPVAWLYYHHIQNKAVGTQQHYVYRKRNNLWEIPVN